MASFLISWVWALSTAACYITVLYPFAEFELSISYTLPVFLTGNLGRILAQSPVKKERFNCFIVAIIRNWVYVAKTR